MIKWTQVVLAVLAVAATACAQDTTLAAPTTVSKSETSKDEMTESSSTPSASSSTEESGTAAPSRTEPNTTAPTADAPATSTASSAETTADASATTPTAAPARNHSGRAFDFDSETNETAVEKGSLQDLSLDDIDMSMFMTPEGNVSMEDTSMPSMSSSSTGATAPETSPSSMSSSSTPSSTSTAPSSTAPSASEGPAATMCIEPKGTFAPGERWQRACDENCTCSADGRAECVPRCSGPLFRRGSRALDAACYERPSQDPCCAVMVCADDTATEPVEECQFKNQTFQRGESFKDGCENVCTCGEAGAVSCKPRCPPVTNTTSDRCVAVPDSVDPCCTVVRCDVTLTDHEVAEAGNEELAAGAAPEKQLLSAEALNATAVRVEAAGGALPAAASFEMSADRTLWSPVPRRQGLVVGGLEPGRTLYLRAVVAGVASNVIEVKLPAEGDKPVEETKVSAGSCSYKGSNYTLGEEFHDGCEAICSCTDVGVQCKGLECPTDLGLEMLDPHCLQWEMQPAGFEPNPPRCCPDSVRCVSNGSCEFGGERFANYEQIPNRLTGCERRCFCEMGNLTCQPLCQPMPAAPPADLPCPPHLATLGNVPGDDCCLHWTCPVREHQDHHSTPDYAVTSVPGGFPHLPVSGQPEEVEIQTLEPLDANSVRVVFAVPRVFVGLHGRIELRYTDDKDNQDPSSWKLQVLAPPQDLLATPTLEFTLGGLRPDTEYRVKITVLLRDLQNTPSSHILTVHTLPVPASTLPPVVPVSPELQVTQVNTSWATVTWRRFTDFEMQLIDGVQLRYKQLDDKVYQATPLIHRAVTSYTIENIQPSTTYEVGIFFIPFPGQTSELQADVPVQFTTKDVEDMYKFDVHVDVHHIKATSVQVNWTGVPYPQDKYVNIYRAIYQSDSGKEDFSTYTEAKRDSTSSTFVKNLAPGTRYRLWLEVYLTNGKIKKSNVQDFSTKPGSVDPVGSSHQGKLESSASPVREAGDYYSPLVAVAILAALAIMATLILLLMLMKRRSQTKAAISAGRKSQSAYDNPSYKTCEDQQPAANGNGNAAKATPPNNAAPAAAPAAAAAPVAAPEPA